MKRVFLAATAMFSVMVFSPCASAQGYGGGRERVRVHEHREVHIRESGGYRSYAPPYVVPRPVIAVVLGFPAGHPRRRAIRQADYCTAGGELGRLPSGEVACILEVHRGDPTIHTMQVCDRGGHLGRVEGVNHEVCILD